ncbi:primosomal protein N' [Candidatus Nitrosacidococcus tergens]|uniref:Replication restart protein PriA n=1 Tax=Candidatus Nitrosacidococcus tergens TaxID=553981 RepID=A0A7G1Q760_9GAMM|nr:primosomal protein N' [Candidatus Nitrosacidococcus tergens]CAB1274117.1 Primosome factor n' (replication factor Y) [Candidatus Nitrosacidococcus tergens]
MAVPSRILRIAIPSPVLHYFDYFPPLDASHQELEIGIRIKVPFRSRNIIGILVAIVTDSSIPSCKLRHAQSYIDENPLIPKSLMRLFLWAVKYYHAPPGEVFFTALPQQLRQGRILKSPTILKWFLSSKGKNLIHDLAILSKAPRQKQLLKLLHQHPEGLSIAQIKAKLGSCQSSLSNLSTKGWIENRESPITAVRDKQFFGEKIIFQLTIEQKTTVSAVLANQMKFQPFLLQGVTGSGKTEVYLEIISEIIAKKKQALILVPEIGLTPQILARFYNRFKCPIGILHSSLNTKERLDTWVAALKGIIPIIIGTRSAIWAPLQNLGVIIIDEEHDPSFKQQEGFRYHARDLAVIRAHQANIPIILGTATPSLESLENAKRKRYQPLQLPQRVGTAKMPRVRLIDIRSSNLEVGISPEMLSSLQNHVKQGNQALLFINRRGFAITLICSNCGFAIPCQYCDSYMVVHQQNYHLCCHHCGYKSSIPTKCPQCTYPILHPQGLGTEQVEIGLRHFFPNTKIIRIDRDTTRKKGAFNKIFEDIHSRKYQILIGTQMLAKGHDYPNLTLVGILDADQMLFSSNFRSSERMIQLITQLIGRSGRGNKPGEVLIQTRYPEHPLLQSLINYGYDYSAELILKERYQAKLPPYRYLALLRAKSLDANTSILFLEDSRNIIMELDPKGMVTLLGPVSASMERQGNYYHAQLLLQGSSRDYLQQLLSLWIPKLVFLKTARKVHWSIDVDPINLI